MAFNLKRALQREPPVTATARGSAILATPQGALVLRLAHA